MQNRLVTVAAALTMAAAVSGCAHQSPKTRNQTSRVTVDGRLHAMPSLSCTQVEWLLTIEATDASAHADALLELGGATPIVKSVGIDGVDGFHGVVGGDVGNAEASYDGGGYTITGTAVGSDPARPGQTRDAPFKIEAPC